MTGRIPAHVNVEEAFNEFVKEFGGELVSELVGKNLTFDNADYLFRNEAVVAELKCLEKDTFRAEEHKRKLNELYKKWLREGTIKPLGFGRFVINTQDLPLKCQHDVANLVKPPVERIVKKASNQIKQTKAHFSLPHAKGLLLLANDGNYSLEADAVMYTLHRILKTQYPSINSVVYFTVNMDASMPGVDRDMLVWVNANRDLVEEVPKDFMARLGDGWMKFFARKIGENIPKIVIDDNERLQEIKHIRRS